MTTKPRPELHRPSLATYPRDTILDKAQVANAIGVSQATVDKMDLPCFYPSRRPRYLWGQVLDCLAERAKPTAATAIAFTRRRRRA